MILFKKARDLSKYLDQQREKGARIGFAPTMGALHQGHISLITEARHAADIVVCSIFVNPTQFNDPADFQKYPITLEKDISMLEAAGCNILFHPEVAEIYPHGTDEKLHYDLGYLEDILEGKFRPGHFQGVCRVVHRLLDIVKPNDLFIGQKDYQQCMVIKKLLELTGMAGHIAIHISPTVREVDGLAMSSRNMRLDPVRRQQAPAIYKSLLQVKNNLRPGDIRSLKAAATTFLSQNGFKTDYAEIADAGNLLPVEQWDGKQELVALVAAFLGDVRLIDNVLLN